MLRKRPRAKTFQKALKSSAAKQQAPNAEILVGVKRLMIFWTLSRCSRSSFQTYPPAHFVFRPHVHFSVLHRISLVSEFHTTRKSVKIIQETWNYRKYWLRSPMLFHEMSLPFVRSMAKLWMKWERNGDCSVPIISKRWTPGCVKWGEKLHFVCLLQAGKHNFFISFSHNLGPTY